jgi:hypothetical protein
MSGSMALRAAGAVHILIGLGFGGGSAWAVLHLLQNGELPMTPWGFRAMAGPAEALGRDVFAGLGWLLVGVCAIDIVAGIWLWQQRRRGLRLSLLTTLPQLALGLAFALPFQLASLPLRLLLAYAGRRDIR